MISLQNETCNQYPGAFGHDYTATLISATHDEQDKTVNRPELDIFGLAMLGGGRVFGEAHLYDFPWKNLGNALVVDVGGGVGSFTSYHFCLS